MMTKNHSIAPQSDREILSRRVMNPPRELGWKAFTDPKHPAQWRGPNGFTNTSN